MVHGGGSCSGGGGGSSVYSYGSGTDCDCDDWIDVLRCLGLCCGCKGKNHVHRIFRIWTWIFIFAFISSMSVAFGGFGPTDVPASPSDMIPITRGLHFSFCEGVAIDTTIPISTYLLPSTTLASTKANYSINQTALVGVDRYEYWGFYLLSGSTIELHVCGDNRGDMYIIQGEGHFGSWKEDNYDTWTYVKTVKTRPCFRNQDATKLQYNITSTDEYYFVLTNHNHWPLSARITFMLNRTVYDLKHSTRICNNSKHCHIDFSEENKSKTIIVYVPESDDFDFNVKTACLRRTEVFIYIFMVIPLVMGFLATGYFVCIRCRANLLAKSTGQQNSRALTSFPPSRGYRTIRNDVRLEPSAPPSGNISADPPSYNEATKRSTITGLFS